MSKQTLVGKVAVVAGATRGAGRGIAAALGEQGATVYCTGRSSRASGSGSGMAGRPETIEETAELVTELGGHGIPVRVDHLRPAEVEALFARVAEESKQLDVLVNDIWGGDPLVEWGKKFWEFDLDKLFSMMRTAIETHLITSRYGVPIMVDQGHGLVVELTDGDGFLYRGTVGYDLVKTSIIRLAFGMSEDASEHGVACVALTPGFLRNEAMLEHFGVTEANWKDGAKTDPNFAFSETPRFVGRAIAALAADANVLRKTGRVLSSWGLAREYGFTDVDGSRPDWGAHFSSTLMPEYRPADDGLYAYWTGWAELKRKMEAQ